MQPWALVFGAWLVAAASTLGALFLSDVMQLAPCSLCWYQRIFMFSLAVVPTLSLGSFSVILALLTLVKTRCPG